MASGTIKPAGRRNQIKILPVRKTKRLLRVCARLINEPTSSDVAGRAEVEAIAGHGGDADPHDRGQDVGQVAPPPFRVLLLAPVADGPVQIADVLKPPQRGVTEVAYVGAFVFAVGLLSSRRKQKRTGRRKQCSSESLHKEG